MTLNLNSISRYDYYGANVKGVFDVAGINSKITVIAAYDDKDGTAKGDGDFGPVDFLRVRDGENTLKTTTGEVRLDTEWTKSVNTLIGVFASSSDMTNKFLTDIPLLGVTGLPSSLASNSDSFAVFANVFWNLTDSLELSAGLRYDDQTGRFDRQDQRHQGQVQRRRVAAALHDHQALLR